METALSQIEEAAKVIQYSENALTEAKQSKSPSTQFRATVLEQNTLVSDLSDNHRQQRTLTAINKVTDMESLEHYTDSYLCQVWAASEPNGTFRVPESPREYEHLKNRPPPPLQTALPF